MSQRSDEIPSWIEAKLFENVLHETIGEFSKILNFKTLHALPPGENYGTVIVKVETEVLLKSGIICSKSFMLKVAKETELAKTEFSKWNTFTTETGMYQEIIPELEEMYNKIGLKIKLCGRSYKLPVQKDYVLMENLKENGFRNAPRMECLDMEHCKAVLKKLAQWHAASAVRLEKKGLYASNYNKGIFIESGKEMLTTLLNSTFKHILNSARQFPNNKDYLNELEGLEGKLIDLFYKQTSCDENEFKVLSHGDCWCNNIMFQYDSAGKLKETYFVDFQIPNYSSPAQDLFYFILTSAQLDIKLNKFDFMIKYYHDNLIEYLKLLEYAKPLPTRKELQMSLLRHGNWAVFSVFVTMAATLCDPTDEASGDNLFGNSQEADKFKQKMYSNERVLKHLEILLPWLCYRGAFEC